MLKVFPASMIAMATVAVPVPGLALASPWVLQRLGLMPSRWREAHALSRLRREQRELAELGRADAAATIERLIDELEHDAEARDAAARADVLLAYWDTDRDGTWDAEERAAYDLEVQRLIASAEAEPQRKRWFLQWNGQVVGPMRWTEVPHEEFDEHTLACLGRSRGWVALRDLLPDSSSPAPLPLPPHPPPPTPSPEEQ